MNKIEVTRHFYRCQIRKEEVNRRRADLRNLMVWINKRKENECSFCTNQWIVQEPLFRLKSLLQEIFKGNFVCAGHIETLFSKILQILLQEPALISSFLNKNLEESYFLYVKKIRFLFEIVDNQNLMKNHGIQEELFAIFSNTNSFVYEMLSISYGLNLVDEDNSFNEMCQLKLLSSRTVFYVFQKYPLLFQKVLSQFSLMYLFQNVEPDKLYQFYQILTNIYNNSFQHPFQYQNLLPFLEQGLRQHLRNIKQLVQSQEEEKQLSNLLLAFLKNNSISSIETIYEIVDFCVNKTKTFKGYNFINLSKCILDLYKKCLNQELQEYFRPKINKIHQFVICKELEQHAMDIQFNK